MAESTGYVPDDPWLNTFVPPLTQMDRVTSVPSPGDQMQAWINYERAERICMFVDWLNERGDSTTLKEMEELFLKKYKRQPEQEPRPLK